ncbi:MAG: hypothetical protein IT442_17595 [Phycisphaeraceae bacterium]|nr:hypothetical protein [Phycisphaeraceae bacterium]
MIIAGTNNVIIWWVEYDEETLRIDAERSYVRKADPQPAQQTTVGGVMRSIRGAAGIAKSQLGLDPAPDSVVTYRWTTCTACERFDRGHCGLCGCNLPAKVRLAGQKCPLGRW